MKHNQWPNEEWCCESSSQKSDAQNDFLFCCFCLKILNFCFSCCNRRQVCQVCLDLSPHSLSVWDSCARRQINLRAHTREIIVRGWKKVRAHALTHKACTIWLTFKRPNTLSHTQTLKKMFCQGWSHQPCAKRSLLSLFLSLSSSYFLLQPLSLS